MLTITGKATRHLAAAAIAAAFLLAGCGGGGDNNNVTNPTQSSFSATLSGALSGNYSGVAAYGTDGQGNFGLALGTTQNGISIIFVRQGGGVPGTQEYSIADLSSGGNPSPGQFWVIVSVPGSSAQTLAGKSGTLKITSTSGNHLKGTFQFTALTAAATPQQVSVSGSFDAVTGAVTIP